MKAFLSVGPGKRGIMTRLLQPGVDPMREQWATVWGCRFQSPLVSAGVWEPTD